MSFQAVVVEEGSLLSDAHVGGAVGRAGCAAEAGWPGTGSAPRSSLT